jgi:cytochrome c553
MRRRAIAAIAGAVLLAVGVLGALVAAAGLVSVGASGGHLTVTTWFLQFAKERSVALHAHGVDYVPPDDDWQVMKGAGHYHAGCLPCHGDPDRGYFSSLSQSMLPRPPYLHPRIAAWDSDELFYMTKHGIKLTGMPAWPSQRRDDEVNAVVAFLLELPELDDAEYEALVGEEAARRDAAHLDGVAREAALACGRCHGVDGRGRGVAAFPKLAGQSADYLIASLEAYAQVERHSGMMQPVAAGLEVEQARAFAAYYSALPPDAEPIADAEAVERGRVIARDGIPEQRVPPCADCHGPGGARRRSAYPHLAGQYADYLVLQLELFQAKRRGGTAHAHLMDEVAPYLTREQMRDVAAFYASRLGW